MLHGSLHNDPFYKHMLDSNLFYFVPIVNPDGLALIEQEFKTTGKVVTKRKNQNPEARTSLAGKICKPEDSGVDLNRNYAMDWGNGNRADYGHGEEDLCSDPCGDCYRGKEPFSEKETQAMRDFINTNKDQIKFVVNIHSNGNSWIFPYNGRVENDIETRNPGMLQVFQEIGKDATFPAGNQHEGNSKSIIGD